MIQEFHPAAGHHEMRLVLSPNRAATVRMFTVFFALLACASGVVAGLSFRQGNVFAPAFALLYLGIAGLSLGRAWRSSGRAEVIAVGPQRVVVRCLPDLVEKFEAPPNRVRVVREADRVRLRSHGREVEIGDFLSGKERAQLAARLTDMLAAVPGGRGAESGEEGSKPARCKG